LIDKLKSTFQSLSDKDRLEIILFLGLVLICTILILLGLAWSRGRDVDYFKERIILMEERFTVAEKNRNDLNQRMTDNEQNDRAQTTAIQDLQIRTSENERWLEEFKKLPLLPKPKQPPQYPRR